MIGIGVVFLIIMYINAVAPQPPAGKYGCGPQEFLGPINVLILNGNGTGTFDGQQLTWRSVDKKVIFEGDVDLEFVELQPKKAIGDFIVTHTNGWRQICSLH
jgi:hypothetical protein